MLTTSLERFALVLVATGWPVAVGVAGFAVWYLRRAGVRLSEETVAQGVPSA